MSLRPDGQHKVCMETFEGGKRSRAIDLLEMANMLPNEQKLLPSKVQVAWSITRGSGMTSSSLKIKG